MQKTLAIGALAGLTAGAMAQNIVTVETLLNGEQEVPQNEATMTTDAVGTAILTLDLDTNLFSLSMEVTGITVDELLGVGPNESPIHIHVGMPGETGPIVIDLGFLGEISATESGFLLVVEEALFGGDQGGVSTSVAENIDALFAANLYYNVHTSSSPSGLIRGDIVPAPSALAMMGVAGLVATRRRR